MGEKCDVKNCKAWCCKGFFIDFAVPPDLSGYMALHGYSVINGKVRVWIDARCKALTPDNLCAIYGKPERPEICETYDCRGGCWQKRMMERDGSK